MALIADKTIDGVKILVQVDGKPIGLQTDGSINVDRDTKEVVFKTADRSASLYKNFTAGQISWNIDQSAYFVPVSGDVAIAAYRDLFAKMTAADAYEVDVVCEYVQGADSVTISGKAIISNLSFTIPNSGEDATFSCSMQGSGALTIAEVVVP